MFAGFPFHRPPPSSRVRVRENKAEATERSEVAGALGCGAQVNRGMGFHPPHLFRFSALQDLAVKRGAYPISQWQKASVLSIEAKWLPSTAVLPKSLPKMTTE
jgi:hypothetical protein